MDYSKITVVINTFKSEDKIYNCLNSINSNIKVIIVENSKKIEFKKNIEKRYQNSKCYLSGENLGYAKGNNFGLKKVETRYALVLNPDAILGKETIKNFLISANKIKDFAIMGPAKQDEYEKDDVNFDKEQVFQVDYLKGFAMFLNLEQFKQVGFFDENFFIYLEEIDLCRRLRNSGKKIYIDPNIKVFHEGGKSHDESINFEMELSRNWHWMWSQFYFQKKYYGYFISLIKILPKFFISILRILLYSILLNKKKILIYFYRLRGIISAIFGQSSWYRPRIKIE